MLRKTAHNGNYVLVSVLGRKSMLCNTVWNGKQDEQTKFTICVIWKGISRNYIPVPILSPTCISNEIASEQEKQPHLPAM